MISADIKIALADADAGSKVVVKNMRKDKRLRHDKRLGGCHNPVTMGR